MNGIIVEGNTLTIGCKKITVKYPIKEIEKINGKYIVLLKIPRVKLGVDELNNILCYNEQGIICWQISNKLPSSIVSKEQIPYIAIQVIDGKLYATDFWGRKFNVDTENGKLIDVKIVHQDNYAFVASAMVPIGQADSAGNLTFRSGATIVAKEEIATAAGAGAQKYTTDLTGNQAVGMIAGMAASMATAKGLNGIEAGAKKLEKPKLGDVGADGGAVLNDADVSSAVRGGTEVKYSPINPGPLTEDVANSFNGATYTERVLTEDTVMYRVSGGNAKEVGSYMSITPQGGGLQSQLDLALNPAWGNTTENVTKVVVPKGTTIYEGIAAPQNIYDSLGNVIGTLPGGGNQVYIPTVEARWFQ